MRRRKHNAPTPQTTMHLSMDALEFIERHKSTRTEPKHAALDRILNEYEALKNRNEELEVINDDLRDAISASRELRAKSQKQLIH